MKVLTLVGTRPELIKLSRIIEELDKYAEHILVHTGQNYDYELNEIFFKELGIRRPDYLLNSVGETLMQTISNIITKTDEIFELESPDAILILGDTNSCLGILGAKRRKIPIFHLEAGNRCFDQRVPEEINRKIVDHLSDINLVYTEHARNYLEREGIKPEMIIKTGSPMKEVLEYNSLKIVNSEILSTLNLTKSNYFLVSAHREENIDNDINFSNFLKTLSEISFEFKKKIIVSTHPRTRKRLEKLNFTELNNHIIFLKPLGFFDYVNLQINAACVISDSGTITEEAAILKFPAVTIRESHERPEGMDAGTLIMCGMEPNEVISSIKIVMEQQKAKHEKNYEMISDYNVNIVSTKVVKIIHSYINYVNREVWKK